MSQADAAHHIYWQYRNSKRQWRRFTGRPVRKFRRLVKRKLGKGRRRKGQGKGRKGFGKSFMWTQEEVQTFLSGKGKHGRSHTRGKGFGRKGNPKDRNGHTMACHGCGSTEHLIARCPAKGKGKGNGPPSPFAAVVTGVESAPSGESRETEPTAVAPPWDFSDLVFEAPFAGSYIWVHYPRP